ncbi:MAG: DNA-binding transcriptional LysR family regulator [Gammaproteobacteria bacterium]|jgi:DNA-binding transcriptional LysR family regulator
MQELHKLVHSPHHLFVFEVCGRLLSFTKAAQELGVSQPAVSFAIRQLEDSIGFKLFLREHRRIALTRQGEQFYNEVSKSLERILKTALELNRKDQPALVTLSVSTAFANYWVIPRLSGLHHSYPQIDLRLQVVDKDSDLEDEDVSLGIRRGKGNWPHYQSRCITTEELIPIASAAYITRHGQAQSIENLSQHHFIHLEEPFRPRPKWKDWFATFDFDYIDNGEGLRLNDYALVIQAAMSGEGIALGWRHVVDSLIDRGLLVQALPQSWVTGEEFHLIWSSKTTLSPEAGLVRDWLLKEARSTNC